MPLIVVAAYLASIVLIIVCAHVHRCSLAREAQLRGWKERHMARERRAVLRAALG